jgi:hypothetical protein
MMKQQHHKDWLELSLHGELAAPELKRLEEHLAACTECRMELESLKKLHTSIQSARLLEPTDALLQEARMELRATLRTERSQVPFWQSAMDKIDELFAPWAKVSLAGATMLVVGFMTGYFVFHSSAPEGLIMQPASGGAEVMRGQAQIANMKFDDPDASDGEIAFRFDAVTPLQMKGNPNDPGVQSVLTRALMSEENPGVRLRAVSAITSQIQIQTSAPSESDNLVKHALVEAMKFDDNPGVRRQALQALRKFKIDDEIKLGLLHVLNNDKIEGMRVDAITSLALAKDETYASDQNLLDILRKKVESDNNRYVRQGARAVLQEVQ